MTEPCGPTCMSHTTHPCEKCGRIWGWSDKQIITQVVKTSVGCIEAQELWAYNPLANPGLTKTQRQLQDALWKLALERGLTDEINKQVDAQVRKVYECTQCGSWRFEQPPVLEPYVCLFCKPWSTPHRRS